MSRRVALALLAAGCASSSSGGSGGSGGSRGPAALHFPLPGASHCSRGFAPGARHFALDVPAPTGTPVLASGGGVVVRASGHPAYGLAAILYHPGLAAVTYTLYAHLSSLAVHAGDRVAAGAKIGEVGRTGDADGPHLHWEVLRAAAPLPLRAEGPLGIPGDAYRVDPAGAVVDVPTGCE